MSIVGTRVIRGPDWCGKNEDSGAGNLGTVVDLYSTAGKVKVVWDVGNQGIYKAGADKKHELYIYDNGPTGVVHKSVTCDICHEHPVTGIRWKCRVCHDFDMCTSCYMQEKHTKDHEFIRYLTENSTICPVTCQKNYKKIKLHGILPGASVTRGMDWEWGNDDGGSNNAGEVVKLTKWGSESFKGGVLISWSNGSKTDCRMGGDGSVDLSVIAESKLHYCFPELLPVLDVTVSHGEELQKGDKVVLVDDSKTMQKVMEEMKAWNPAILKYRGQVGTVVSFHNGSEKLPTVQYQDVQRWTMHRCLITKQQSLKKGDVVRIVNHPSPVMTKLQEAHGGWADEMDEIKGKVARIHQIDDDGDVSIKINGDSWCLSPVCCQPVDIKDLTRSEQTEIATQKLSSSDLSSASSSLSDSLSDCDDIRDNIQTALLEMLQNVRDKNGNLVAAAAQGDLTLVQKLVSENPSKVDVVVQDKTALQMACYKGHTDIVNYLISHKASVNLADNDGDTPLHLAVSGKNLDVVKILCNQGVKINTVNQKKQTPFHLAVCYDCFEIAEYLVNKSCDVNTQDEDGDTPLHEIIEKADDQDMINMMLSHDKLRLDICNSDGLMVLHMAIMNNMKISSFEKLIKKLKQVDSLRTKIGSYSPLHVAAVHGNTSLANCLVQQNHAINVKDSNEQTPLHLAVIKKSEPMIDLLLARNADINSQDTNGDTPLHLSVSKVSIDELLCETVRGKSVLRADSGADVPYLLVQNGAQVDITNKKGLTPLDLIQNVDYKSLLRKISQKRQSTVRSRSKLQMETPAYWKSMTDRYTRVVITADTPGASEEYHRIYKQFTDSLSNKKVVKIERIQHIDRWQAYAVKKLSMERTHGEGCVGERHLFHGTKPINVAKIIADGLDFRYVVNGLYGDGAYLAVHSKTSDGYAHDDDNRQRYMFVTKALIGKYTDGTKGMKVPPAREDKPDLKYDSTADDMDNPLIFVLFDNSQMYAEHLITYK